MIREKRDRPPDMTDGSPAARIFCFALPLMLGNIFQQLYTLTDTVIVGRVLGMEALAALGATEWLTFLLFGAASGLTAGFGVTVAHAYGGRDDRRLLHAVSHAVLLSAAAAIGLGAAGLISAKGLLRLMGTPEEIQGAATVYLRILYGGIPVTFAGQLSAAVLRALGDSKTPFAAVAVSSVCNIVLDVVLVAYGNMGIAGAALSTVAAQLAAAVWCVRGVVRHPQFAGKSPVFRKGWSWQRKFFPGILQIPHSIDGGLVKEQLALGLPMAFQNAVTAAGGLLVQSAANSFGVIFVAGFTAANRLYGLLETAASSYGQATVSFIGQNFGAKRRKRLKTGMRAALRMGVLTALLMSGVMIFGGRGILNWFLSGKEIERAQALDVGLQFLHVLAVFFPFLYVLYILRAGIQGLGNGVIPLFSSWVQLLMRVGCACLLTARIGYRGLFWGEAAAWLGADILLAAGWIYYRKTERGMEL